MKKKEKESVAIIGAGPGGLSAGMILTNKGYDVSIYEKAPFVGGRTSAVKMGPYTFDLGPTFFHMIDVLEEIFESTGRNLNDYIKLMKLDPLYDLVFEKDKVLPVTMDREQMKRNIEAIFPGDGEGYARFLEEEEKKFSKVKPALQSSFTKLRDFFKPELIKALPYLDFPKSVHEQMGKYFSSDLLKIAFTFQTKYLGMSPWEAPALFSILSFLEHDGGIYHVEGGLNQITKAMGKAIEEDGGQIHLETPVKKVIIDNKKIKGLELENGTTTTADYYIINADFAHAMKNLIPEADRKKYTDKKLDKMGYSCSTLIMYLGLSKKYDLSHHTIYISRDYKANVKEITENTKISDDPSFYLHNPSVTDPTLAPEGHSCLYVLVPLPNNDLAFDWKNDQEKFRNEILDLIIERTGFHDLRENIKAEKIISPIEWEKDYSINKGAVFNLKHNLGQMLYFRPRNKFEEYENCYLVGGGTHPGSGLPTIFESGRITGQLIQEAGQRL